MKQSPLDKHIERVEKYGFARDTFPVKINGHVIICLTNDGYMTDNGERLHMDLTLFCGECLAECGLSGTFGREDDHTDYHAALTRLAAFGAFVETPCPQ